MVDFGAPYAMDGTIIPGAGLRRQLQRDVGTGSGVVRPGDLKITQMTPPGAGVKIAAGDDLIQSGDPGANRETYGIPLFTEQNYMGDDGEGLPGTGSQVPTGGRRDMVFHEVLDPELPKHYTPRENWPDGALSKLSVIQNVGKAAKRIEDVPALAGVTGYALAAITYPADTATVTNSMIEDLRVVQSPRSAVATRQYELVASDGSQAITSTAAYPSGQTWPSQIESAWAQIEIPEWAARMRIVLTWSGVQIPTGAATGYVWVQVGENVNPDRRVLQARKWANDREGWRATGDIAVPASMRGKPQWFFPRATRLTGTNATAPVLDSLSGLDLLVEFYEGAV